MNHEEPEYVTRAELKAELQAQTYKLVLWLAVGLGLLKFDLPTPITAGAVGLAVAKAGWTLLTFGRS